MEFDDLDFGELLCALYKPAVSVWKVSTQLLLDVSKYINILMSNPKCAVVMVEFVGNSLPDGHVRSKFL